MFALEPKSQDRLWLLVKTRRETVGREVPLVFCPACSLRPHQGEPSAFSDSGGGRLCGWSSSPGRGSARRGPSPSACHRLNQRAVVFKEDFKARFRPFLLGVVFPDCWLERLSVSSFLSVSLCPFFSLSPFPTPFLQGPPASCVSQDSSDFKYFAPRSLR